MVQCISIKPIRLSIVVFVCAGHLHADTERF